MHSIDYYYDDAVDDVYHGLPFCDEMPSMAPTVAGGGGQMMDGGELIAEFLDFWNQFISFYCENFQAEDK